MSLIVYCNTGCIWHHYVDSTTHSSKHIWKMFRNMPITPSRRMALFNHIDLYLSSRFFVSLELISTTCYCSQQHASRYPKYAPPSQQISIMYWLKWWFFKFQSSVSLTYVDLYDNSSNSSHMLFRYSLTYMAILRIPVICFPGIRWLIWQFFEF